eukprot:TRINITY_DN16625_c0_g1_i1.p1 TRINITY_DN16625_c0_g1~~TRINITY_DN16625_c0_g1_i1.p1  ORF type:complete len:751 (+),score=221.23 TRINITY_DN16625_c0_g1_i1:46-2253(+)
MQRGRRKPDVDPGEGVKQICALLLGKTKDFDAAAELVEKGVGLDHPIPTDGEGHARRTLLHEACIAGDEEALMWLGSPSYADGRRVGRGVNVNYPMDKGGGVLHHCVQEGRVEMLQKLCDMHTAALQPPAPGGAVSSFRALDLNRKDDAGVTPVQAAINLKKPELARVLLKAGAVHNFGARSFGGQPPRTQAQYACVTGEVELLDTLCELGVSAHQKDMEGNTLLHVAVEHKQWAVIDYLMSEKGLSINTFNVEGRSPLTHVIMHQAGTPGFLDVVTTLVQKGAAINVVDCSDMPPLHHALLAGDFELTCKLLELGAGIRELDRRRNAAVHWAAQSSNQQLIQRICQVDEKKNGELDVNQQNAQRNTPLHKACVWNRPDSVCVLLAIPGVNQNLVNAAGRTPLHEAAEHGSTECVAVLLGKNKEPVEEAADVRKKPPPKGRKDAAPVEEPKRTEIDIEDGDGSTPLQVAMEHERTAVVEALIQAGASVRRKSARYGTLLHQAVAMGSASVTAALVGGGADIHGRDDGDRTPLHVAVSRGFENVTRLLLQHGADVGARDLHNGITPLHIAAANSDTKLAAALLDAGAGATVRDSQCRTPFHAAAAVGSVEVGDLLVAADTDVDATDLIGRTPLHHACVGGHSGFAELCLSNDADPNFRDQRSWTPLHVAVAAGASDCVAILLDSGAELAATEQRDRTPLLVATEGGKVDVARLLVRRWQELRQQRSVSNDGSGACM